MSETSIDLMPVEIMYKILSYLNVQDIKQNIALVSKKWNEFSNNPWLIRELKFGPILKTEKIAELLREYYYLQRLTFISRNDVNILLTHVGVSNARLRSFRIDSQREERLTEVDSETLLNMMRTCTQLEELCLKRCTFDDPDEIFRNIGACGSHLKSINFNHSLQLGTEQLKELVNGIHPLKDCRIYCLAFNRIGSVTPYADRPVTLLLRKMNMSLTVLKLNMLGITDDIMDYLASCELLEILHMYRLVNIHDEALFLLGRLPKLRSLVITVPRAITSSGWRALLDQENMERLHSLTVSNSYAVDDSVLTTLANNCKNLTSLGLPGCRKMTDIGKHLKISCFTYFVGIKDVLQNCCGLKYLNLFSTKSSVAEAFHLLPNLVPNLGTLIYRSVDRQDQDFEDLQLRMPNLNMSSHYRYL